MAVARTGSITNITSNTNTGSQSISIPSDAVFLVVVVGGYYSGVTDPLSQTGSLKINSTNMTVGRDGDASYGYHQGVLFYYNVSAWAGTSKTLAWDWYGTGAPTVGVDLTYAFYKGVDTTTPIRSSGGVQANTGSLTTGSLTAQSGDMIVAGTAYTSNVTSITWTGVTNQLTSTYNSSKLSFAEASPSGNTTVSITLNDGDPDGSIMAIVFKASGGTQYNQSVTGNMPAASGTVVKQVNKNISGNCPTAIGQLIKSTNKSLAGVVPSPTGQIVKQVNLTPSGNFPAASATLSNMIVFLQSIAGNFPAASGVISKLVNKNVAGDFPSGSGVLTKSTSKNLAGNLPSPAGVLGTSFTVKQSLTGIMGAITGALSTVLNPVAPSLKKLFKLLGSSFKKLIGG